MKDPDAEFDCRDCGTRVVIVAGARPIDSLCAECRIIAEAQPEDRETLRGVFRKKEKKR